MHPVFVRFRTYDGHYLCAENQGGGEVSATCIVPHEWEIWTLQSAEGQSVLGDGAKVHILGPDKQHYLCAENGGGGVVDCNVVTKTECHKELAGFTGGWSRTSRKAPSSPRPWRKRSPRSSDLQPFEAPPEDIEDYTHAAFDPISMLIGTATLSLVANRLIRLTKDLQHDRMIVDTRGEASPSGSTGARPRKHPGHPGRREQAPRRRKA
jgi:hypothetical protein